MQIWFEKNRPIINNQFACQSKVEILRSINMFYWRYLMYSIFKKCRPKLIKTKNNIFFQ